jgi:hypothetical protein
LAAVFGWAIAMIDNLLMRLNYENENHERTLTLKILNRERDYHQIINLDELHGICHPFIEKNYGTL